LVWEDELLLVAEMENLSEIEERRSNAEVAPCQLLALVVVPRSFVAVLCQKADHVATHVAGAGEALGACVLGIGHDLQPP
jgi:hypothetical protein